MGNTHDTEMARIEADFIGTRWRTTDDYRWGYTKDRGPETWWIYYPSASGGNQSPVDIATEDVHVDHDLTACPLQICYNPNPKEAKWLSNTGNTARVDITNSRCSISGGPCKESSFILEQFHLHWGETDAAGSEHLVNSRPHSAELHLVHWNEDLYESYEEAIRRDDGIAIIAVFIKVAESNCNKGLLLLSKLIEDVVYRDQRVRITEELEVKSLLPDDVTKYWTYQGSFTTPPCYETVTWIVLVQPITVTSEVLAKLRKLRCYCESEVRPTDEFDGLMAVNSRPLQPLGTRKISTVETSLHRRRPKSYDRQIQEQTAVRVSIFPELFDPQRREELFQWLQ